MTPYRIARADLRVSEDAANISRLQGSCFPGDFPYEPSEAVWWLVYDRPSGEAVAFAGLGIKQGDAYLCRAGVMPSAQGQGLQRKLIRVRLKEAQDTGMRAVVTEATCGNPVSINNLVSCGFRAFTPSDPWGLPTSLYMRKEFAR